MLRLLVVLLIATAITPRVPEAQIKYPTRTSSEAERIEEAQRAALEAILEEYNRSQAEMAVEMPDSGSFALAILGQDDTESTTDDQTPTRLLGQGQLSYSGKPELEADLLQIFIMPDAPSWKNIIIPIVLSTSAPSFSDVLSEAEATADLLGVSNGTIQIDANLLWERRDTLSNGELAISGLYGKIGGAVKMNVATAEGSGRETYFLGMPAANVELRLTTGDSPDADDHSGVIIFGFTFGASVFLQNSDALAQVFAVEEIQNYLFGNFAISWFPMDGAAVNLLSYSRSWGNDIAELKDSFAVGLTLYPGIF